MTCKIYQVLVAACAVALANQVAGLAVSGGKTKPTLDPMRIPKLPAFAGVTLSGMDFGSNLTSNPGPQDGGEGLTKPKDPKPSSNGDPFTLPDYDQAIHYLEDRDVSLLKLPIAWETLQHNITQLEVYTDVVATVTSRKAQAIVSLSMSSVQFANFTSNVTESKGGPLRRDAASATFVELWGKLAKHFQHDRRVIFHLMAIPIGGALPRNWNQTIQAAVTAIRKNGARNAIVLPSFGASNGTTFNTFRDFPKDFERMQHIKNPDGTTDGIVFDVSQTIGPKSPNSQRCQGIDVSNIVEPVVKLLKENERQAIIGTLAAGSDPSCTESLVKFAKEANKSYPALAGFVMYGAGAFNQSSPWTLVKEGQSDSSHCSEEWVDQPNFASVQPYFPKKANDEFTAEKSTSLANYDLL
ncbi:hypothetical protein MJO28_014787 [Puccinia striiformis f. sp. tritici]|uniref:cellulase n=2 Tax=Puccinia striiformis TaxID=27350 RepID=A0A2S4VER9_9BASI|nr:hypothetical protein Pst134EB_027670 [Puccinia striiformis f. sp. tritici]KAI7939208.1 hypothetical protein MJO28_014787 [Puccinia striiformis f. sp. tritici]KAI9625886.1 hypothetical protein H4Q26_016134 [Puccinia striiformis f. sp. tritici PST-130]POW08018.1 hypothetical protein PSTT_07784 [Puccinia striiformis]